MQKNKNKKPLCGFLLRLEKQISCNNIVTLLVTLAIIISGTISQTKPNYQLMSPVKLSNQVLSPLVKVNDDQHDIFGFAPYWTFDKLDKIDFGTLTTLSYFDLKVDINGNIITDDQGYITFTSDHATKIFQKAHNNGTRVVVTLTQMNQGEILAIMDSSEAQQNLIKQSVSLVKKRGIDGINIDFEYGSDAGNAYRQKFTRFVTHLTNEAHRQVPSSKVSVSVYASAVKEPKIYDIRALSAVSDQIFMMAYDFAVSDSDVAMPTSPLYGAKEGKYWYDVSSAVNDFLTQMPANKLILGIPWYGYNYVVSNPQVKSATAWGGGTPQTFETVDENGTPDATGWDDAGQVGYKAYYESWGGWRMVFIEDSRSLKIKYDFAKDKKLAGIGIWALGFEDGKREIWDQLKTSFGNTLAKDFNILKKIIHENI